MPKLTAEQKAKALEHIIVEVLDQPLNGQLHAALKQHAIADPNGIACLTERQLEKLQCVQLDEEGNIMKDRNDKPILKTLFGTFATHLIHFKWHVRFLTDNQQPVLNEWLDISHDDFDTWRNSKCCTETPPPTPAEEAAKQ